MCCSVSIIDLSSKAGYSMDVISFKGVHHCAPFDHV